MKKFWLALLAVNLVISCSEKNENEDIPAAVESKQISLNQAPIFDFADKTFSFQKDSLPETCSDDNEIVCAVMQTVICTINPAQAKCDKSLMPSFIFMEDESLDRPTQMSYKIIELKPLAGGQLEVHTDSTCNGNWFGLCHGRIIYVMTQQNGHWVVKDIYARALETKNGL